VLLAASEAEAEAVAEEVVLLVLASPVAEEAAALLTAPVVMVLASPVAEAAAQH
jgi:hypothetical protein